MSEDTAVANIDAEARRIHDEAIVIDATCPLATDAPQHLELYRKGGFTAMAPTIVAKRGTSADALLSFGGWHRVIREREDIILVRKAQDIRDAKKNGQLGLILHFQGTEPLYPSVDMIDAYKVLGLGIVQLTYNKRCHVGDGCEEPSDAGLSRFGKHAVRRMNETKVIVDCAHTGLRTSMDAIETSTEPVILSHANAAGVHRVPRNVGDDLYRAIAATGGVIGVVGFPAFVSSSTKPTLDQFIDHIKYIADLVGPEHVGLGIDYYGGQHPICPDEVAMATYKKEIATGIWSKESYPPPPYFYPEGIETPDKMANLTAGLLRRGFNESETKGILGENWMRVYAAVWG